MSNLIRDSAFDRLVRFASSNKYFTCAEERDPSLWKKYVHEEKSRNAAHHGHIGARGDDSDTEDRPISGLGGVRTRDEPIGSHPLSSASSQTQVRTMAIHTALLVESGWIQERARMSML